MEPLIYTPEYIYSSLKSESELRGLPKVYRTDLITHDRETLDITGTQDFLWMLHEYGTDIFPLEIDLWVNRPRTIWPDMVVAVKASVYTDAFWYCFVDGQLTQIDPEEAKGLAAIRVLSYKAFRQSAAAKGGGG